MTFCFSKRKSDILYIYIYLLGTDFLLAVFQERNKKISTNFDGVFIGIELQGGHFYDCDDFRLVFYISQNNCIKTVCSLHSTEFKME